MQELEALLGEGTVDPALAALTADLDDESLLDSLTAGESPPEFTIDREALYNSQTSKIAVGSDEDAAPITKAKRDKSRKKNTTVTADSKPTPPPVVDNTAGTKSAALQKKANVADLVNIGVDAGDIPVLLEAMDLAPKKVGEKAKNLMHFCLGRDHLSNYTRAAIRLLDAADASNGLTTPELVKAFENGSPFNAAYKTGTARSQAQQQSKLFGIYGMVAKTNGRMTLDRKNPIVKTVLSKIAQA